MNARLVFRRTLQSLCAASLVAAAAAHAETPKGPPEAPSEAARSDRGGRPDPAQDQAAPPEGLPERLARLKAKGPKNLKALTPVREELLGPGELKREVPVSAGHCYHLLVVGESDASDIEAELSGPQGPSIGQGKGKGALALPAKAPFCAEANGTLSLKLRAPSQTRAAYQLVGAEDPKLAARFPVGGEGKDLVAIRMRDVHKNRGAKAAVTAFEQGSLDTSGEHSATFEAEGGACYLLVATGVPSLRALELEVLDQRGHSVARSEQQTSIATVKVCADLSGKWTVRARAFKGYGAFGLQAFLAP